MIEEVRKELFLLQDLKYQQFHSSLCPGIHNIIGVRVPQIRKLVKKLLKEDYLDYLNNVDNKYYEEDMIEGLLIVTSKMKLEEKMAYLEKFVPKINNWAVCDIVCASFKISSTDLDAIWNFILKYKNSKKEYELRFMIIMMLDHFLIDAYIDKVLTIMDNLQVDYYYTNMAIAWLISVIFVKNRDKALTYLHNNQLSTFTYNKALQKIIESNRVSKLDKEMIKSMRK